MKTKLLTALLCLLPLLTFAQNYEKEGDDLFAQAQYEQAEKKYKAAIAILGESQTIKQKRDNCSKCKSLLVKAETAEHESRYSDAAEHYSNLYAIHALPKYQSKVNAMKQKVKQVELAEREHQAKIEAERRAERERQNKIEAERRAEQERQAKIEARTFRKRFRNNISGVYFDGTLTISGEGEWEDFDHSYDPWGIFKDSIKSVVISNNITNIAAYAFYRFTKLTSVTIPNSVTKIGPCAFSGCKELTSITIPNRVRYIGDNAFSNCTNLSSISIPYGVKYIRNRTFEGCLNLISVTLPNSVIYLGYEAFRDCKKLSSISMSNNLNEIDNNAFQGCHNISIIIPNSIQKISYEAFRGCGGSITLPERFRDKVYLHACKSVTYY